MIFINNNEIIKHLKKSRPIIGLYKSMRYISFDIDFDSPNLYSKIYVYVCVRVCVRACKASSGHIEYVIQNYKHESLRNTVTM